MIANGSDELKKAIKHEVRCNVAGAPPPKAYYKKWKWALRRHAHAVTEVLLVISVFSTQNGKTYPSANALH